jgi:hypothetical protein
MSFLYMRDDFFTRIPREFIRRVFDVADCTEIESWDITLLRIFYSIPPPFFLQG